MCIIATTIIIINNTPSEKKSWTTFEYWHEQRPSITRITTPAKVSSNTFLQPISRYAPTPRMHEFFGTLSRGRAILFPFFKSELFRNCDFVKCSWLINAHWCKTDRTWGPEAYWISSFLWNFIDAIDLLRSEPEMNEGVDELIKTSQRMSSLCESPECRM